MTVLLLLAVLVALAVLSWIVLATVGVLQDVSRTNTKTVAFVADLSQHANSLELRVKRAESEIERNADAARRQAREDAADAFRNQFLSDIP
jgi:type II secretory pathway component PulJ